MKVRTIKFTAAMALIFAWSTTVVSLTQVDRSFSQLVDLADIILVGTARDISTEWGQGPLANTIFTVVTLDNLDVIKGDVRGTTYALRHAGGRIADLIQSYEGVPRLTVGTRYVLFVSSDTNALFPVVGIGQGVFIATRGSDGSTETIQTVDGRDVLGILDDEIRTTEPGEPVTFEQFVLDIENQILGIPPGGFPPLPPRPPPPPSVPPGPAFQGLSDYIAANCDFSKGPWCELVGSKADDSGVLFTPQCAAYEPSLCAVTGPRGIFTGWGGAALDHDTGNWYFTGGGHNSYYGSEVYRFSFRDLTWNREYDPPQRKFYAGVNPVGAPCWLPEPLGIAPHSLHSYDGLVWDAINGRMFYSGGAGPIGGCYRPQEALYAWSPGGPDLGWENFDDPAKGFPLTGMLSDGRIILRGGFFTSLIDLSTSPPTVETQKHSSNWQFGVGAVNPEDDTFWINSSVGLVKLFQIGGTWDSDWVQTSTQRTEQGGAVGDAGVEWHAPSRTFVFWNGERATWTLDPATRQWARLGNTGSPSDPQTGSVNSKIYSKWEYLPTLDVFVGYEDTTDNIWIYRLPGTTPAPPPVAGDFETRCASPGVVNCFGLDTVGDVMPYTNKLTQTVDNAVKASGAGSLKFTIASKSTAGAAGYYARNFSDDRLTQFTEGEEFYIQWRQRFSPEMLTAAFGGGGWKTIIIGAGDLPGGLPGDRTKIAKSCTQLEIVVNNGAYLGLPQVYHSCGVKDGRYEGLDVTANTVIPGLPSYRILYQNAMPEPYCFYNSDYAGCYKFYADEWMTFQVQVKTGTWYKNDRNYLYDSTIRLWIAREGQPSQLVIDRSPEFNAGYDLVNVLPAGANYEGSGEYGKLWLLPYDTGKDPTQVHPTAYTWYDEIIVSTERIPDPGN